MGMNQRERSITWHLPRLGLALALVAGLVAGCGGGGGSAATTTSSVDPANASLQASTKQQTQPGISAPPLANGVTVEFKAPDTGSTAVTINNPSAPAAFAGVGVNLVGATDLLSVPCVAKAGATPCPAPGPGPTVSASSIRAAINLPFATSPSYYWKTGQGKAKCTPLILDTSLVNYNDPVATNGFFDTFAQTDLFTRSDCGGTSQSIASRYGVDSSNAPHCSVTYAGACLIADVTAKHLDWVQVYFAVPADLATASRSADLAAFEAAQLVYQTAFGSAPKYVELRNEPDNDHITPAAYNAFLAAFNDVLPRLADQRASSSQTPPDQKTRLQALKSVQVVGPGLTSSYKLDYNGDPLSNLPSDSANKGLSSTLWFQADGSSMPKQVAQTFFDTATAQKLLLSSHAYDEKHLLADGITTLDALAGLKNLFRVRDTFQTKAPSPVMLTEMAESVEHDVQTRSYMGYCGSLPGTPLAGNTCGVPGDKDVADGFNYAYPNCLAGKATQVFAVKDPSTIVDMCHNQAATLNRNIINYANQGVLSELVWSASPTPTTTRHGLLTTTGVATLMNGGTEPLFKAVSTLGYTTVYPALWTANNANTTVDAVVVLSNPPTSPPVANYPAAARVALANTDSVSHAYALNFGSTPFAQFTQVSWASTIGGSSNSYVGTAIETTATVLALPSGTTFGSDSRRLVITLPARSAVTLDLKR